MTRRDEDDGGGSDVEGDTSGDEGGERASEAASITDGDPDAADVVVLREGTEGLSTEAYADALRERLPGYEVRRAATPGEERALAAGARVITGNDLPAAVLAAADRLELFACTFAGVDHLPLAALRERGAVVTNAAGIHAPGIAEQVLGFLLTFARDLHVGAQRATRAEWRHYRPGELKGSTVTVVGAGAIGTETLRRLRGFDVRAVLARHSPSKGVPDGLADVVNEVVGHGDGGGEAFHRALAGTDSLVLACPLTEETGHLVDAAALATLPPEAVVVNVARGGVVDTDALLDALRTESVRGAAVDVTDPEPLPPDHPLWGLGNVLVTPHVGGHTPEHWPRLADVVAENLRALDAGEPGALRNVVARPDDAA